MTTVTLPRAPARRLRLPAGATVPRLIAGTVILVLWEVVVRAFAPAYVATPTGIVAAIPKVISSAAFLHATGVTLLSVAEGLAIAVVLGTVIGLLMGRSQIGDRMLRHYVNAFYAMPMIVVLPLFSLWFGYTGAARLATIVFAAIFSVIVSVSDGARSVPREFLEVGRSFRSSRLRMLFEIVMPASMPYFLASLRLAGGRALIGAVVAEFFTAIEGLGYFILYNSRTFHHNEAFVAVIFLAAFGVGFDLLVNWSTRHLMPWYRRDEKSD
ncbi:MAG TPA: ABC transporter permease [Xanthobacteraceae bacterium]|nr:ABC transporter permease [Xanthobacteraceae bacterium]